MILSGRRTTHFIHTRRHSYCVQARPSYGTKGGATCNQPTICTRNKGGGDTSCLKRTKGGVSYLGDRQPRPYCSLSPADHRCAPLVPPYPPPQGLPPLPNTDKLNHLLGALVSAPTIPTAPPTRRSERPQNKRTSDIYLYSSVVAAPTTPILVPYLAIVHGDMQRIISTPHLTPVEVADAAWLRQNALTARSSSMMMSQSTLNLPARMRRHLSTSIPMASLSLTALLPMVP
jgi:hypothetical protein